MPLVLDDPVQRAQNMSSVCLSYQKSLSRQGPNGGCSWSSGCDWGWVRRKLDELIVTEVLSACGFLGALWTTGDSDTGQADQVGGY